MTGMLAPWGGRVGIEAMRDHAEVRNSRLARRSAAVPALLVRLLGLLLSRYCKCLREIPQVQPRRKFHIAAPPLPRKCLARTVVSPACEGFSSSLQLFVSL